MVDLVSPPPPSTPQVLVAPTAASNLCRSPKIRFIFVLAWGSGFLTQPLILFYFFFIKNEENRTIFFW